MSPCRVTTHRSLAATWLSLLLTLFLALAAGRAGAAEVRLVELNDAIGPASADFFIRSLEDADAAGAALVVIRLNTPGGLDAAMRDMIQAILASPVPVATWVAPGGARAASAGTYILYASHFALMAPATNVGSSTPVNIGGGSSPLPLPTTPEEPAPDQDDATADGAGSEQSTPALEPGTAMERKVINDAVAYLRGLAELRGRNQEWAEQTVRAAANLTASEALEQNVIDFIAGNIDEVIARIDGQTTLINGREVTVDLGDPDVVLVEPDWRHQFLSVITNPNVAYILLMIGFYGIILEFYNPGMGVPGITGVICLLLGAYALQMLPINFIGLALLLVGVGLMIVEAMNPSFGVFGLGGVVAFVLGSIVLMDTELPAFQISLAIIAAFAVASAGLFVFTLSMIMRARKQKVVTGTESMVGGTAVAPHAFAGSGQVRAFGEIWWAESEEPVAEGDDLEILAVDGLTLKVKKQE
ncbi:MAG: nodulation protein NfeD [Pseudohongiellaceae bacterium]